MANPIRVFGIAIVLSANLEITMEITVSDGTTDFVFTTSLPSLVAGVYSPHGWLAHLGKKIRQWLYDRIQATVGITTKPPAVTSVDVSVGFPSVNLLPGAGLSLPHLHIGNLNCSTGVGTVRIKQMKLDNTNGWATKFGLTYADESGVSKRAITPTFGQPLEADGRFQPRWIYVARAHYKDTGDIEEKAAYITRSLADGSQSNYEWSEPQWYRTIEIVTQQRDMTGPGFIVGKFSGFGSGRHLLNLQTIDETVLYGMTGTYLRSDNLATPRYLRIGKTNYAVRFRQTTGNALECFEAIPSSYSPNAGDDIEVLSELHVTTLDWARTGKIFPYEVKESTGETSWISKVYGPNKEKEWRIDHEKPGRLPHFTMRFDMKRNNKPGLAVP